MQSLEVCREWAQILNDDGDEQSCHGWCRSARGHEAMTQAAMFDALAMDQLLRSRKSLANKAGEGPVLADSAMLELTAV